MLLPLLLVISLFYILNYVVRLMFYKKYVLSFDFFIPSKYFSSDRSTG